MSLANDVLELARWAPSGDNSQPWRFKVFSERDFDVYGYDTRGYCVYDLDGGSSQLAHGMLLETIAIAATRYGCRAHIALPEGDAARIDLPGIETPPLRYRINLEVDAALPPDPLAAVIVERSVQRWPMRPQRLTAPQRASLEEAARPLRIAWFDSWLARARVAVLCARNARIRMTIPEAYAVHRSVIAWHATTSEDRLPDASLGAGPILLAMMRSAMVSWQRLDRLNRWTGTLLPRLALDFLPGVLCSAQLAIVADREPTTLADRIAAGRAIQRVWLRATALGLQMQPQYTPLVFARYVRSRREFTQRPGAQAEAATIAASIDTALPGASAANVAWLARIGPAQRVRGRSLRLPLAQLVVGDPPPTLPRLAPV